MGPVLKIIIAAACGIASYLISALNPAIILSRRIYGKDVRECGSGNAGFSNFKRNFGMKYAWVVFVIDLAKGVLLPLLTGFAFRSMGLGWYNGVWFSGIFGLLGHAYPVWYDLKGGKGFLECLGLAFVLDWRAGLLAFALMVILLFTVKIMSVSTLSGLAAGAVALWFLCPSLPARIAFTLCVVFVWVRHRSNLVRLIHGNESKFILFKKREG